MSMQTYVCRLYRNCFICFIRGPLFSFHHMWNATGNTFHSLSGTQQLAILSFLEKINADLPFSMLSMFGFHFSPGDRRTQSIEVLRSCLFQPNRMESLYRFANRLSSYHSSPDSSRPLTRHATRLFDVFSWEREKKKDNRIMRRPHHTLSGPFLRRHSV